jgi:ribonucleotide reductase beta subunit family protein with ferritin-like domain
VLEGKFHNAKTFYLIILFVQTVHSKAYVVLCSQYCDKEVKVHFVTGDHVTLLGSKECATIINQQVADNEAVLFKKSMMSEGNK